MNNPVVLITGGLQRHRARRCPRLAKKGANVVVAGRA